MSKIKTFITDKDGLSSKDYLLIISTGIFFLFISIGLILVLLHKEIDEMYLRLLDMVSPVVMTVVGGVMGVQAVETFTANKRNNTSKETERNWDNENNNPQSQNEQEDYYDKDITNGI